LQYILQFEADNPLKILHDLVDENFVLIVGALEFLHQESCEFPDTISFCCGDCQNNHFFIIVQDSTSEWKPKAA
jgi:hypothetical protein